MKKLKISLLSQLDAKGLGLIVESFLGYDIPIYSIMLDSQESDIIEESLWQERTEGKLQPIPPSTFEDHRIPYYLFSNHSSPSTAAYVRDNSIDLLVNAWTPRILKSQILKAPRIGVVNCHPGLLPNFRGCTNVEWAIFLDEKIGNTVHLMTENIDEGPIILQEDLSFLTSDTYSDIRIAVLKHNIDLLARGVIEILEDRFNKQNTPVETCGRYFKVIDKDKMSVVLEKTKKGQYAYQL